MRHALCILVVTLCLGLALPGLAGTTADNGAGIVVGNGAGIGHGVLPDMAAEMADELDAQLAGRFGASARPVTGQTLIVTCPANLGNLELVSPLARSLAEEMATWFVSAGYKVQEVRKAKTLLIDPEKGELYLTRRANLLDQRNLDAAIILAGTYSVTNKHVRFNMRLIHAGSNEVLAMCSATMPVTDEVLEMLDDGSGVAYTAVRPSVGTRIMPRATP